MAATNKSCYRLYAGHGNWINLSPKTTQDLLQIFEEGIPCRYKLSDGIFIDIIPHDVDCNSKNIDMFGLMRADLVYETQVAENHVQQLMSHYIRTLLDDQGIIDAFPPLRSGEDLPIITSIPTHRHLSLVPSVVGAVRRGPKPATLYKQALVIEDTVMLSSSSASSSPPTTARITKKKGSYMQSKRSSKRNQANIVDLIQPERPQVNIPDNSSQNNNPISLFDGHHSSNYMENASHHNQVYHHTSYSMMSYPPPPPQNNPWSYHRQVSSSNTAQNTNFTFDFDFDQGHTQRQSPTDILHEYEYQRFDNTTEMYPTSTLTEEKPTASSNDSTDSYVPNSPHHWGREEWDYQQGKLAATTTATTAKSNSSQEEQFFKNDKQVTTLPMDRILLSNSNLILSHSPQL